MLCFFFPGGILWCRGSVNASPNIILVVQMLLGRWQHEMDWHYSDGRRGFNTFFPCYFPVSAPHQHQAISEHTYIGFCGQHCYCYNQNCVGWIATVYLKTQVFNRLQPLNPHNFNCSNIRTKYINEWNITVIISENLDYCCWIGSWRRMVNMFSSSFCTLSRRKIKTLVLTALP